MDDDEASEIVTSTVSENPSGVPTTVTDDTVCSSFQKNLVLSIEKLLNFFRDKAMIVDDGTAPTASSEQVTVVAPHTDSSQPPVPEDDKKGKGRVFKKV